ncbi:hypothetical protein WOLCODRAFT_152931 [Wolfiporia cocos MD-104 SS10]|uniref:Uncharacterized protein n=1 Tax=Wolfiporia cocos (strain MD-104) TaxID=742152 RepID=A0A2H3K1H7_WOLCO|nr:hypothetical protein WOLCODRAFT_152931 [Wolfiporia cocos MD-104 SS10]
MAAPVEVVEPGEVVVAVPPVLLVWVTSTVDAPELLGLVPPTTLVVDVTGTVVETTVVPAGVLTEDSTDEVAVSETDAALDVLSAADVSVLLAAVEVSEDEVAETAVEVSKDEISVVALDDSADDVAVLVTEFVLEAETDAEEESALDESALFKSWH